MAGSRENPRNWTTSASIGEAVSLSVPPVKSISKRFEVDRMARETILKQHRTISNISGIYKDTLRAMLSIFSDFSYITSENNVRAVKCVFANPERPIAKQFQENNLILPIISISQISTEDDSTKIRYGSMLVHEKYWDDDKKRAIRILSFPPKPVRFTYQVAIWAKYRSNLDQILEQIRLAFKPNITVNTQYTTLASAFIVSEEDFSDATISDKQDRLIKKGINVVVETAIPSPKFLVTSTGEIEEVKTEYVNDEPLVDGRNKDLNS